MLDASIEDPVATAAKQWPDRILLAQDDGDRYTASAFEAAVSQIAGGLHTAGIGASDRIAIFAEDRLDTITLAYAIIRAGATAVLVDEGPDLTDRLDAGEVSHAIADGGTPMVPDDISVLDLAHLEDADPIEGAELSPDRSITLMFTSGTTGEPKPVVHTASNHQAASKAAIAGLDLDRHDRWYVPLGLHHMGGFAPIIRCLPAGIPVILSDTTGPTDLAHRMHITEASVASVVPTMVHRLVEQNTSVPSSLRCLLVGGAPLSETLYRRAREDGWPIWASYGLTETVGQVATAEPIDRDRYPGTVGRPLPGIEVQIIDTAGNDQPPGEVGRIEIIGETVSPSVIEHDRFVTADIGHSDADGRLWVHGRADTVIQSGGELVHPQRIEAGLIAHPDIEDVAVIGLPDDEWGERVVAAVVGSADDLDAWCADRFATHERPKAFIAIEEIPRTASGTVDRHELRDRFIDR